MYRKESGLMDFQKEVIDCKNDFIILNWCRCASKTFTLAKLIENNKPKNVIYITESDDMFYGFIDKIETFTKLKINYIKDINEDNKYFEVLTSEDGTQINLYGNKYKSLNKNLNCDYILYDDLLPFNIGVKADKVISTISYNNYDKWLQRFYPTAKVIERDSNDTVSVELMDRDFLLVKENFPKQYFNEYAILDNPFNRESTKYAISYDISRTGMDNISEMIIKHDKDKGYYGYLMNVSSGFRTCSNDKFKIEEKVEYLRNVIIRHNGNRAKDYENIDMIMIDGGAGGHNISVADYLLEDWTDEYTGIKHYGLIDKTNSIYEGFEAKYPNAIDKIRIISPVKYLKIMKEELKELLKDRLLQFSNNDIDALNGTNIEENMNILLLAHRLYEIRKEDSKMSFKL